MSEPFLVFESVEDSGDGYFVEPGCECNFLLTSRRFDGVEHELVVVGASRFVGLRCWVGAALKLDALEPTVGVGLEVDVVGARVELPDVVALPVDENDLQPVRAGCAFLNLPGESCLKSAWTGRSCRGSLSYVASVL